MGKRRFATAFFLLAAPAFASYISIIPVGGVVSGAPGQTVGWGYTINNSTSEYIGNFQTAVNDLFPSFGVYTGLLDGRSAIAPGATVTVAFDLSAASACAAVLIPANCDTAGFAEYAIDPGVTPGSVDSGGTFQIFYDLCGGDSTCSTTDGVGQLEDQITLSDPTFTIDAVPEPASLSSLGTAAALLGIFLYRKRRREHSL